MWSPIIGLILLVLQLAPSSSSYVQLPLQGNVHPVGHYYTPGPAQLLFGRKNIGSNTMVVFDSGTTYTYIPNRVYPQLLAEVKNSVSGSLEMVPDQALPVCWKGPFASVHLVKGKFKPLAHEFTNQVMHIPPENYLILTEKKNVCLGILETPNAGGQMIIIGDVTMQDLLVIYDNVHKRVGWVSKQCKHTVETPSIHAL